MSGGVAFSQFLQPQTGLLQQVRVFMSVKLRKEDGKERGRRERGRRKKRRERGGREGRKKREREEGGKRKESGRKANQVSDVIR